MLAVRLIKQKGVLAFAKRKIISILSEINGFVKGSIKPKFALEINNLSQIIYLWVFTKIHQSTYGLTSRFLQTP